MIEKDGSVSVYVGSSVLGQGLETTLAQVAADTLKLPFEQHQNSARLDDLSAARASAPLPRARWWSAARAVMDGCNNLLAAIRAAATERLGFPNEEIEIADGEVSAGGKRASLPISPASKWRAASPPRRAPTATARMPAMSRSIRAPATSIFSTMWRSRTSASPSIRTSCTARRSARWCRGSAACSSTRSSTTATRRCSTRRSPIIWCRCDRLLQRARHHHGAAALEDQSARRQGRGRGRHGGGGGDCTANAVAAALKPLGVEVRDLPLSPARLWGLVNGGGLARKS